MRNMQNSSTVHGRRTFMKTAAAGIAAAGLGAAGCSRQRVMPVSYKRGLETLPGTSTVSFTASKDTRQAAHDALKPLENDIANAIRGKKVVIKANVGQVTPNVWLNASDPNQIRGILDVLTPICDDQIVIAEGTAAQSSSTFVGYENYGFMPLEKEYNVKLVDLNDYPTTRRFISDGFWHPQPINLISLYLDPEVYLISATRLKPSGGVIATLSLKNVVMGSPVHHYMQASAKNRNEKQLMHAPTPLISGNNRRGLSHNIFQLATMGVQPDMAVLDGVIAMEGSGPVNGTPVEHGVALASTDWLACDRIGAELMGVDYAADLKYLVWCGEAGMGNDSLDNIRVTGPDYRQHIRKYDIGSYDAQREWIIEDEKVMQSQG